MSHRWTVLVLLPSIAAPMPNPAFAAPLQGDEREPVQEHFRTVGGFAGAWLPFSRWVDVDAALGLAWRLYENPSTIYGSRGLREDTSLLTFRLGVSSRSSARLVAARVGAALVVTADVDPRDVAWQRTYLLLDGSEGETRGTTPIGGLTVGLTVGAGFEIGGGVD
jgi:hypothetical protein